MSEIAQLVPTKSDADIAADLKARMQEAMKPVLALFDEATAHGLLINWDNISPAAPFFKHHQVNGLRIVKHYA